MEACTSYECGLEWLNAGFESPDVVAVPPVVGSPNLFRGSAPAEGDAWWIVVEASGSMPMATLWRPPTTPGHLPPPPVVQQATCRITVLDGQGAAIPDARVVTFSSKTDTEPKTRSSVIPPWRPWFPPVRTNDKGTAAVPVPAGRFVGVHAGAPGLRSAGTTCRPGSATVLRLHPESRIALGLRDTDGEPLPDALARDQHGFPVALSDTSGRLEIDTALASSLDLWFELASGAVLKASAIETTGDQGPPLLKTRTISKLRSGTLALDGGAAPPSQAFVWRQPKWPWMVRQSQAAPALRQLVGLEYAVHALPEERLWFAADGFGHGSCHYGDSGIRNALLGDSRPCPPVLRAARPTAGVVVDETGTGVANAEVWLEWSGESTLLANERPGSLMLIRTDSTGAFASRRIALPSVGFLGGRSAKGFPSLYLRAEAVGYLPVPTEAFDRLVSGPRGAEVTLLRGAKVTGRIADGRTGRPLAGSEVGLMKGFARRGRTVILRPLASLNPNDGRFARLRTAHSDAAGAFELTTWPGRYDLLARAPNGAFLVRPDVVIGALDVDIGTIFMATGSEIVGEVLDGGHRPVAGARILAAEAIDRDGDETSVSEADDRTGVAAEVQTDASGRFRLGGLNEATRVDLAVSAPGLATEFLSAVAPTVGGPMQVILSSEATISGRVTHEGEAVATWVRLQGDLPTHVRPPIYEYTGADGRFRFRGLKEGRYDLMASGGRQLEDARTSVRAVSGEEVDVALDLGEALGRLAGRVTAEGAGLPAVSIATRGKEAVTDAAGRYSVGGLKPGQLWVTASRTGPSSAGGPHDSLSELVDLRSEQARLDFDFSAYEISGRALWGDGSPAAGVELSFSRRTEAFPHSARSGTDDAGTFDVRLVAGVYDVGTLTEDGAWLIAQDGLEASRSRSSVEVRFPGIFEVEGTAYGLDADELSRLLVEARNETLQSRPARVESTGRFRIKGVESGVWLVVGRISGKGRRAEQRVRIENEDARVDLDFKRLPTLRGSVTLNGQPHQAAPVLLMRGRDLATARRAWTRHDGSWEFRDLEPGDYTLGVGAETRSVSLQTDEILTISLDSGTVAGTAHAPSTSMPLAGTTVTIWPRAARRAEAEALGLARQAFSDVDGRFVFQHVPAGAWSLEADGGARRPENIDVAPGATVFLHLP